MTTRYDCSNDDHRALVSQALRQALEECAKRGCDAKDTLFYVLGRITFDTPDEDRCASAVVQIKANGAQS
ncbi:MAG: hypothetical protein JWM53_5867 [bacterium]|nr:hypothetical protein [bacterium]